MQVTEISAEGLKREYNVVVEASDILQRLDAKIHALSHQVKMPGFRPGKVPFSLVKKLHGKAVLGEVLEETVNELSARIMQYNDIQPSVQHKIEITSYDEGENLEYALTVEVLPYIPAPDFSKIKLERLTAEVEDGRVDEILEGLADQQKVFEPAGPKYRANLGDVCIIDFEGRVDGESLDGRTGTD